jgi:chromosome segregation ATPase
MAKINKIRFINLTYNENRHIYNQTFNFYNGENTLMNFQNGGGKTVMVQMMMQPIVPKQRLKDRIFKTYFKTVKSPVYIMIEWLLDKGNKKVLTGIGVKKVLSRNQDDDNENLRIITFISEYEKESEFDIDSIDLLEESHGIVRFNEFEKVIKTMSNGEKEGKNIKVFRWELPEDKKEYARKLSTYRINQLEWKNLMVKINETEAGLNSFFDDCKTNKNLIKKWLVPTIEDQLNKDDSTIDNLKEIMKNHAEQIVKNEAMLKEKELFDNFKNGTIELVSKLEEMEILTESLNKKEFDLGNLNIYLIQEVKKLENLRNEIGNRIKQIEISLKELEYEKLSYDYHLANDSLNNLKNITIKIDEEINLVNKKIDEYLYKKNSLLCSKLNNEIIDIDRRIVKFETELEIENSKQEDIKSKLNDIEFSLKVKYKNIIESLKNELNIEKTNLEREKTEFNQNIESIKKLKVFINRLSDEVSTIKGKISHFDEMEKEIKKRYSDFTLNRNISTLEYSDDDILNINEKLNNDEETVYAISSRIKNDMETKENELKILDKNLNELKAKNQKIIIDNSKNENIYSFYEVEKDEIVKILNRNGLKNDDLFNKKKIIDILNVEIDKYKKLVNEKTLENSILKNQLDVYKSGKTIELSNDLKRIFEDNNIFVEFGYEWLRNSSKNQNIRLKMLKNNPFLPYSIIISKKDLIELKEKDLNTFTSIAVPIIVKEELENELKIDGENSIYSMSNISFLMAFNEKLLNKNYLKEITEELNSNINKNKSIIENAQNSSKNLEIDIIKIENFKYEKEYIEKLEKTLRTNGDKVSRNIAKINNIEEEIQKEKSLKDKLLIELRDNENEKSEFKRKREDIEGLLNLYKKYKENLKVINEKKVILESSKTEYNRIEDTQDNIKEKINNLNLKINSISNNINKSHKEYIKYEYISYGNIIDDGIENLEAKRLAMIDNIGSKIQDLKDILEDYKNRKDDKLKDIRRYKIEKTEYESIEFSEYELDKVYEEIENLKISKDKIKENKDNYKFKIAEVTSDINHILKTIKERYNYDRAKEKEYLRDINYNDKKIEYNNNLKEAKKDDKLNKQKIQSLINIKGRIEEYDYLMDKVEELKAIDEEDLNTYSKELTKAYKKLKIRENDLKSLLITLYGNVENDFSDKAEVFKNLFRNILDGEKKYNSAHALNAFSRTFVQIERKIEQHMVDIKKIDDMEKCIIDNAVGYLKNVYDEMNNIDKNSTIDIEGKRRKMLMINLPEKDKLDDIPLKTYLKSTIDKCVLLHKDGKSMDGLLLTEVNTYDLFDRYISINKIVINLLKIELNKVKKKTWQQVISETSGGERFVSAFVVFISLLTYMRGENMIGLNNDSKVLIMDNPFGPITSEHLLKPLFEIAKKYNTQLICLTDLKEHTIFDRFNLIYSINIEKETGRDEEYIDIKTIKKELEKEDNEDEVLAVSMYKLEKKSKFHLMN